MIQSAQTRNGLAQLTIRLSRICLVCVILCGCGSSESDTVPATVAAPPNKDNKDNKEAVPIAGTDPVSEAPATSTTPATPETPTTPAAAAPAAADRRKGGTPWQTWPQPQVGLILTGEQLGYFEPCGCTSSQLGGMSRRADLVRKLTDAGWLVRGLDVGSLSRRSVRQSQIKFETTLAALRELKYIAIGLGPEELRLKPDFLLTQHITDGDSPLPFLCANIEFFGIPDLGTPLASVVVEENGLKIGVTAVLSDQLQKRVLPYQDITWKDPVPELQKVMASFDDQKVDLRILLSQSTVEESKVLATEFPQFDVILTAEGVGDPDPSTPPQKIGKTLLIESGRKGKYVGVLGVYGDENEPRFRFQLVALERDDFEETPSMVRLMANYQERLRDEKIVLADAISAPHPSGATFVGADKCGECHTTAFEIWKETPHAHALESLDPVHKRTGYERLNGVARMHDPECLACHVTGWDPQEYFRFRSGFLNEDLAADDAEKSLHNLLAGSQCENCHGPGSQHIEAVEAGSPEPGKQMRVTLEQAKGGACEKCHDSDNSPKFDFDEYWERVRHPGLD